jgi:hypothetical protein
MGYRRRRSAERSRREEAERQRRLTARREMEKKVGWYVKDVMGR